MAFSEYNHALISSSRVQGTDVYSTAGDKIGSVDHVMIDKKSGQIQWVVISFGGFLGLGESHYPLPWHTLKYDQRLEGYVTGVTADQLRDAPEFSDRAWQDAEWGKRMETYYGVPPAYAGF
jgi:sporulation protein YlmC with PRC-barrel domain